MRNYITEGDILDLTAPYAVSSGGGAQIGAGIFGVATNDVANAAVGQFKTKGVFDLTKATGVNWVAGALLYWDNAAKNVTNVVASNLKIGVATQAQINGDVTCRVRLNLA